MNSFSSVFQHHVYDLCVCACHHIKSCLPSAEMINDAHKWFASYYDAMYITEIKYTGYHMTRVSHMIMSSLSILCSLSLFGYTAVTIVMVCPHPFLSEGCLSCQVLSNGHLSPRQPQSSALHAWSMRLSAVLFLRLRFMFYMHVCISEFTTICQQIEKKTF